MICPCYQLWPKLQLFTPTSQEMTTYWLSSVVRCPHLFQSAGSNKATQASHAKELQSREKVFQKCGVGLSVREQIHSNPTYNTLLGKAQEEVSHPRTSGNKENCPGKRLPGYIPFSFLSNSLSLAEVPFNPFHSQGRQRAPDCHREELNFLLPTLCASVSPLQEMMDIVKAIYDMMGKYTYPVLKEDTPRQHVDIFFQVRAHTLCVSFKLTLDQSAHKYLSSVLYPSLHYMW